VSRAESSPTWFGQPRGLTILFLTEMWEKFSFFGMRALQVYYMTKQLHFGQARASLIYGLYGAGVYLTPIVGGIVSDRWLGRRRGVIAGGLMMALGHFMMASEALFFPAMVVIALGNGLFLPNLPSQVGALYAEHDPRRAGAYNLYYMGVNLGAFLAPLVCGTLGEVYGWHYGFGAAGVGMCLGLLVYVAGARTLPPDTRPAPVAASAAAEPGGRLGLLVAAGLAVVLFRSAYEQTGNTLAVWIDEAVDRHLFGALVPATWIQSFNPMFVFLFTPVLVGAWTRREARGHEARALRRMALGALGAALSYLFLAGVIRADALAGRSTGLWPVLLFFAVFTLAELYILPVGLGLFARLAPPRFRATTIAAWFLAAFAGNLLAGILGTAWTSMRPDVFFAVTAGVAACAGAVLFGLDVLDARRERAAGPGFVV